MLKANDSAVIVIPLYFNTGQADITMVDQSTKLTASIVPSSIEILEDTWRATNFLSVMEAWKCWF